MMTKYLERKLMLEDTSEAGCNSAIELEYYLVETQIEYKDDLSGRTVYGISIRKKVGEACFEEKIISNFSCCINKTRQIINILAGHTVTPVGLQPVLEDMLGV